jgi:phosphoribosyl 1,2-cyclic phosphodiesterase
MTQTLSSAADPHVTVQSLGSGSSGNAFLITSGETTLMLDCGVGIRTIRKGLGERGLAVGDLDAVLITHEHTDHIRNLSCVTGTDVPIVATLGTCRRGNIPPPQWERIEYHRSLQIGEIAVWAVMVKHDAAEPCGYLLETPSARISIFTDLGSWHDRLAEPIGASDLVVLESNHDLEMLQRGPYPMHLKRRVASDAGHLSNELCATSLASTLANARQEPEIWLAHLSNTNNEPHVAERETRGALEARGIGSQVIALPRTTPGPLWSPAIGDRRGVPVWAPAAPKVPVLQLGIDALL